MLAVLATAGILSILIITLLKIDKARKIDKEGGGYSESITESVRRDVLLLNVLVNSSDKFDDKAHFERYNEFIMNPLTIKHIQNIGEIENA
jgi:hypothetical protein